jgi:hypothetical protein
MAMEPFRSKSVNRLALQLGILTGVLASGGAAAETLAVPGQFTSIQAAIDAAADGDRIEVGDGTYPESLLIVRRADLDLVAVGAAVIDAAGLEVGILVRKSRGIRIKGFKILDPSDDGIRVAGSEAIVLASNRIKSPGDDCIELDETVDDTPTRRVRVDRNTLVRCGSHGVHVDANRVRVEDNRINRTESDGIELGDGRHQKVLRNTVLRAGDDGIEVQTRAVLLHRNRVSRSRDDGIQLTGNGNRLTRNSVVRSRKCAVNDLGKRNVLTGNRLEDGNTFLCNPRNND